MRNRILLLVAVSFGIGVVQGQFTNPYPGEVDIVMGPGDYWHVPAGMAHSNECASDETCVIFTYGDAPWDVEMVEN